MNCVTTKTDRVFLILRMDPRAFMRSATACVARGQGSSISVMTGGVNDYDGMLGMMGNFPERCKWMLDLSIRCIHFNVQLGWPGPHWPASSATAFANLRVDSSQSGQTKSCGLRSGRAPWMKWLTRFARSVDEYGSKYRQ